MRVKDELVFIFRSTITLNLFWNVLEQCSSLTHTDTILKIFITKRNIHNIYCISGMELHMVERFKSNNPARSHLGLSGICHPRWSFSHYFSEDYKNT